MVHVIVGLLAQLPGQPTAKADPAHDYWALLADEIEAGAPVEVYSWQLPHWHPLHPPQYGRVRVDPTAALRDSSAARGE